MGEASILAELEIVHDGKGVRVEFTKIDGLISHTISLVNADEKTPVLTSRSNEIAQPCFTELHQQGDMIFLTGANGPCHWSMSVESQQDSENAAIVFDVACRIKEPSLVLSTEYSVLTRSGLRIVTFDEGTGVDVDDSCVRIVCAIAAPMTMPATVRWKYGVTSSRDHT